MKQSIIAMGLALVFACQAQAPSDILISAELANDPIPLLSQRYPAMDAAMAMDIQKDYVKKKLGSAGPAGFKAGLTSRKGQARFGLPGPVAGVLFQSGKLENHAVVGGAAFHHPMIETEIGFVLGRSITRKIQDTDELKAAVREVMPVIELPDLGFSDMKALTGADIIAANVSSRKFIPGRPGPVGPRDLNTVGVTLFRDKDPVNQGRGSDAMGDQWQALLWLANTMIDQGYTLEPGQIFITGALGRMVPGKKGRYRADYGSFGQISFEIR